jgi:hypothetical protein
MQEGQAPQRFDFNVLATFLCRFYNVSDLRFIRPFGLSAVEAWTIPRKTVLGVNFQASSLYSSLNQDGTLTALISKDNIKSSPQPKDPFVHPVKNEPMVHNMDAVTIYNITCRHYSLKTNLPEEDSIRYAVRLNFYNEHMARLQETKEQDRMYQASGAIRGAFAVLTPTNDSPDGKDINEIPMPEMPFGIQNEQFTKTMMLINESNLMNGIIKIPPEVCRAAKLPVWTGAPPEPDERGLEKLMRSMKIDTSTPEGQEKKQSYVKEYQQDFMEGAEGKPKSEYFYAVPKKHVIAWPYHSEAYLAQFEERVERLRFVHPESKKTKLLYFLVPSSMLEAGVKFFSDAFLNKIDRRPITSVGFEFIPKNPIPQGGDARVDISLRSYFTYYSVPALSPATIKCLAPTLCKDFPLVHNWSQDEVERQITIEKHEYEKQHGKTTKITNK